MRSSRVATTTSMGYDRFLKDFPVDTWKLLPHTLAVEMSDGRWKPYPYLVMLSHLIAVAVARGNARLCISLPPRHGKALAVNTPIPTPQGWSAIGELKVGDEVFDERGEICKVTGVTPVWRNRPVASVTDGTGSKVIADMEHEWDVRMTYGYRSRRHTTRELCERDMRSVKWKQQRFVATPRHPGLNLPQRKLIIDPYVLGIWLARGDEGYGTMICLKEHEDFILGKLRSKGWRISPCNRERHFLVVTLKGKLRRLGILEKKEIPMEYLRASREQRLELLRGLVDMSGRTRIHRETLLHIKTKRLRDDIAELIISLGGKVNIGLRKNKSRRPYYISFCMPDAVSTATMPLKDVTPRAGRMFARRSIIGMHYLRFRACGTADTVCIQVDSPSHMFLCGYEMLPTCNSFFISQWVPVWFLANWPHHRIILSTYEANFAATWGRRCRNIIRERGGMVNLALSEDSTAANQWELKTGGGMVTAGAGGSITGKGMDLGILDDPHKNWQEANSPGILKNIADWFDSTFYTRLEPGGSIIVLATRWNENDQIGTLINKQEGWIHVRMPAIADEDETDLLNRKEGEALCPERYDEQALLRIKKNMSLVMWNALFQQRPAPAEGIIFLRSNWKFYDVLPEVSFVVQSWDTASKKTKHAAYSVCQTWGVTQQGAILLGQWRDRVEYPDLRRQAEIEALKWRPNIILIEDRDSGQALVQSLRRETRLPIVPVYPDMDKEIRAQAISPWHVAGRLFLPAVTQATATWVPDFIERCAVFPNGAYADEIDSMSQAIAYIATMATSGRIMSTQRRSTRELLEGFRQLM